MLTTAGGKNQVVEQKDYNHKKGDTTKLLRSEANYWMSKVSWTHSTSSPFWSVQEVRATSLPDGVEAGTLPLVTLETWPALIGQGVSVDFKSVHKSSVLSLQTRVGGCTGKVRG